MQTLPRYAGQGCAGTSAVLALRSGTESAPDPLDMGHEDRLSFHVFAHREAELLHNTHALVETSDLSQRTPTRTVKVLLIKTKITGKE